MPHESQPLFFKGDFNKISVAVKPQHNEVILHSFSGDEIYLIKNLTAVEAAEMHANYVLNASYKAQVKEDYLNDFEKIQHELNTNLFSKLILSRIKPVPSQKSALSIFSELNKLYKTTFNYLFSSPLTGTWIGATPELLLRCENDLVSTVSLAGTKPSDGFSEWTQKEREEQRLVTDFILEVFRSSDVVEIAKSQTYTAKAGPVEHLKTDISGRLSGLGSMEKLLKKLHPTPATCGIPQKPAIKKIAEIESHQRKFYTGYVGVSIGEITYFFVNLRCMEWRQNTALLYVGGGITKSSIGEREWLETERKAETLERALK